jgi:hypothetical protein
MLSTNYRNGDKVVEEDGWAPSGRRSQGRSFQQIVLTISLAVSTVLLSMSIYGASKNHQMLDLLGDYAIDVVNATNKVTSLAYLTKSPA